MWDSKTWTHVLGSKNVSNLLLSVGYTDTDELLKEKLSQLRKSDDGILESIGKSSKRQAPCPPLHDVGDNTSLPPKRQNSNPSEDSKSTTTGSYESEGSNEQW